MVVHVTANTVPASTMIVSCVNNLACIETLSAQSVEKQARCGQVLLSAWPFTDKAQPPSKPRVGAPTRCQNANSSDHGARTCLKQTQIGLRSRPAVARSRPWGLGCSCRLDPQCCARTDRVLPRWLYCSCFQKEFLASRYSWGSTSTSRYFHGLWNLKVQRAWVASCCPCWMNTLGVKKRLKSSFRWLRCRVRNLAWVYVKMAWQKSRRGEPPCCGGESVLLWLLPGPVI